MGSFTRLGAEKMKECVEELGGTVVSKIKQGPDTKWYFHYTDDKLGDEDGSSIEESSTDRTPKGRIKKASRTKKA